MFAIIVNGSTERVCSTEQEAKDHAWELIKRGEKVSGCPRQVNHNWNIFGIKQEDIIYEMLHPVEKKGKITFWAVNIYQTSPTGTPWLVDENFLVPVKLTAKGCRLLLDEPVMTSQATVHYFTRNQ